jgi:hypothetical protein
MATANVPVFSYHDAGFSDQDVGFSGIDAGSCNASNI